MSVNYRSPPSAYGPTVETKLDRVRIHLGYGHTLGHQMTPGEARQLAQWLQDAATTAEVNDTHMRERWVKERQSNE